VLGKAAPGPIADTPSPLADVRFRGQMEISCPASEGQFVSTRPRTHPPSGRRRRPRRPAPGAGYSRVGRGGPGGWAWQSQGAARRDNWAGSPSVPRGNRATEYDAGAASSERIDDPPTGANRECARNADADATRLGIWPNISRAEIGALEEQRSIETLGEGIGRAIAHVEPRLGVDAFAEAPVSFERKGNVRFRERHRFDARRFDEIRKAGKALASSPS
jgi:hypothetical protein